MEKFTMEFDGELIEEDGGYLKCKAKGVRILTHLLVQFVKDNLPLGKSVPIGFRPVGESKTAEDLLFIHKDEDYVHIGCLKESKDSFNKKYIQLIKHLNSKRNVRAEQSGSSASSKEDKTGQE